MSSNDRHLWSLHIVDETLLYQCYMPFVIHGGLFISSKSIPDLGTEIFLLLQLPDHQEKYALVGEVIWHSPSAAFNNRGKGFGIQFNEKDAGLRTRIENLIIAQRGSGHSTMTL